MPMSPRLLRPRQAGGFDPRRISGIGAWFDATDASTYTTDTGVTEWRCKAINGQKWNQTTGASQPTINSTGIGGKAALAFNGTSQWMNLGSQSIGGNNLLMEAGNQFSLFCVCNMTSSVLTGRTLFAKASATSANRTLQVFTNGTSLSAVARGSATTGGGGTITVNASGVFRFTWDGSSASAAFSNNAAVNVSVGAAAIESENILLGARTASSPQIFWVGLIGELVFYNKAISSSEQSALFAYLNAKWGLSLT